VIFRSVSSRLATWMFLGSTLVLVTTGGALLVHARGEALAQTHREAMALAGGTAARIAGRVDDAIAVTRVLRGTLPDRPADAAGLLRDMMRGHPDLDGIAAAYGGSGAMPLVIRDGSVGLRSIDLATANTPVRDQAWFVEALHCNDGCWRRPFPSAPKQRMVVGFSQPMDGGNGVVTAEFSLDWLQSLLARLPKPDGGYAFVLGRDGLFLAHEQPGSAGTVASEFLRGAVAGHVDVPLRMTTASGARVDETSWAYLARVEGTPWTVGLVIPEQRVYAGLRGAFLLDLCLGALGLLLLALIVAWISRRLLRPLQALTAQTERIAAGDTMSPLPLRLGHDEIGRLGRAFAHMQVELRNHIEATTVAARASARLDSQLEIARQIQWSMLPAQSLDTAGFSIHARLQPAQAVGGDLYFYAVDDERVWLLLGDVSDKGIAAALFMARTVTLARTMVRDASTPAELLRALNEALAIDNDACMFTTLACISIQRRNGHAQLASAGHEVPLLWRDGEVRPLPVPGGPALGLDAAASYDVLPLRLRQGDALLLYSDGITEAEGAGHHFFGEPALEAHWRGAQAAHAKVDDLLAAVAAHTGARPQSDDIALLCFDWHHADACLPYQQRLEATHDAVFSTLDQIERYLQHHGVGTAPCGDVRLAAEELMVNIVEHGSGLHHTAIDIDVLAQPGSIVMTLRDNGPPFDPLGHDSTADTDTDNHDIGGLGIHLAVHVAHAIEYQRADACNIVTLRFVTTSTNDEPL
jgi:sigma-B regulation protein RsbU (phosphoserine phosphatase)